jgi:hypothetical protein
VTGSRRRGVGALALALAAVPARAQGPASTVDDPLTENDRTAGLEARHVTWRGPGRFAVVPGEVPAPGDGVITWVRIEIEKTLPVDGARFADYVLDTLNDPRSWGRDGERTFGRTAGALEPDVVVLLATPATSARLCDPWVTGGFLSCAKPGRAVLTFYRWALGVEWYGPTPDAMEMYRRYLVNHEVGHVLGYDHRDCPGRGRLAPVMQQQTKGLGRCRPNGWPFPERVTPPTAPGR